MAEHFRPELHPAAQELVAIYEAVPGALTYPGCCPEALAAVVEFVARGCEWRVSALNVAALLRGEQP
jgi:hypothetical protein